MKKITILSTLILIGSLFNAIHAEIKILSLQLQTRDPITDQIFTRIEKVGTSKIGIVIVDPWNYHWCMTACERVSAMVPRWNLALEAARKSGMTIIWVPSDVVAAYSGYPQRERALGTELYKVPIVKEMPQAKFTPPVGKCMCGPGINCKVNYGHNAMNPALRLDENDLIASTTEEVYSLLRGKDITHVIYMGLHTNMCLYGKPGALKYLWQTGLTCMVARDLNDAFTSYLPDTGFTPDIGTQQIDDDLERAGIPMINVADEWQKAGMWDNNSIFETVRIVPWGKPGRPYFFEKSTIVTLTAPWLEKVEIRYTLDGSEPNKASSLYSGPLTISETKTLRTAAFRSGKLVSIPTDAFFVCLPPSPPKPDIILDDLDYGIDPFARINEDFSKFFSYPKKGRSFEDLPLRMRGEIYEKGIGFRAPSSVRYEIKPGYDRFVARAGVDENMLDKFYGALIAQYPGIIFRIFIDGKMMAESPVMRISQEPWRFGIKIPEGSRFINLVCMNSGNNNLLNFGNWVDAGFITK